MGVEMDDPLKIIMEVGAHQEALLRERIKYQKGSIRMLVGAAYKSVFLLVLIVVLTLAVILDTIVEGDVMIAVVFATGYLVRVLHVLMSDS